MSDPPRPHQKSDRFGLALVAVVLIALLVALGWLVL
jgi:hypothetical protein